MSRKATKECKATFLKWAEENGWSDEREKPYQMDGITYDMNFKQYGTACAWRGFHAAWSKYSSKKKQMFGELMNPIDTAPRDGRRFLIVREGEEDTWEVGRFRPLMVNKYSEVENGLFRKEEISACDWDGFNNFHRATCWCDLPELPTRESDHKEAK
jgi:hypothetical protein